MNVFCGLRDKGQWYNEQGVVKEKVKEYYEEKVFGEVCQHVKLDNVGFNKITNEEKVLLA